MITTDDLDRVPNYRFDVGDTVRFYLKRGREVYIADDQNFHAKFVRRSRNPNSNRQITLVVTNYRQHTPLDLEIEGTTTDGFASRVNLSDCRALKLMEPVCA